MNKVLIVASVASMIDQFNMGNILLLRDMGYKVDIACNFKDGNSCSDEQINKLISKLTDLNVRCYQIDFTRQMGNVSKHIKAFWQLEKLLKESEYDFVHCHSPIGGALSRIACHKMKVKCIYTAHGFHFFKGAPLKNWMLFFPIEYLLSFYTDVLITINNMDYSFAKKYFKMKTIKLIPGVGINSDKYLVDDNFNREVYRQSLGISNNDIMLFSIGELNKNKNHEIVIRAMSRLSNPNIHYFIAGKGVLHDYLLDLAQKFGLENNVHLLGFRDDISELNHCADIFMFPSLREGLGLAAIEAMACGLPLITSDKHGINDYSNNGITGYKVNPLDVDGFVKAIDELLNAENIDEIRNNNIRLSKKYDVSNVNEKMKNIYLSEVNNAKS